MIKIYHGRDLRPNLLDFGIEIPLSADRTQKVLDALGADREIQQIFQQYPGKYLEEIDPAPCSSQDLLLAHTQVYVQELRENPERALLTTYELIGADGLPHRYNPALARRSLGELRDYQLKHVSALEYVANKVLAEKKERDSPAAYLLGGGLHHAMSFGGRGFCLVNDGVIVLRKLLEQKKLPMLGSSILTPTRETGARSSLMMIRALVP